MPIRAGCVAFCMHSHVDRPRQTENEGAREGRKGESEKRALAALTKLLDYVSPSSRFSHTQRHRHPKGAATHTPQPLKEQGEVKAESAV